MPLYPKLEVVLVGGADSPDVLRRALRLGVREVVHGPAARDELVEALGRLTVRGQAGSGERGKVLSFLSCKGGSGATFLATNLGYALAALEGKSVLLIDLNLQFGDAALFVSSAQATTSIADVAHNIHRLDRELLQSSMTQVSPQFSVLPAPEDPARAADVLPEHVEAILAQARTMYDFVVIDAGRSLSAVTLKALDQCELVYAVLQLTLPYVRDARRLRDVFRSLDYPARKIRWIVNRHTKGSEITLDDVRKVLAIDDAEALPNQYDVAASSVNQGVPVDRLAPNSAIARALRALADGVAPEKARPRGGWLSGMFRGA
jgi:pilus assembly protein CpaE